MKKNSLLSLPASMCEEIASMHAKLAVRMFRAVYAYLASEGEDNSIDDIITFEGEDFIARFKAWADERFAKAALRRQRAAERCKARRVNRLEDQGRGASSSLQLKPSRNFISIEERQSTAEVASTEKHAKSDTAEQSVHDESAPTTLGYTLRQMRAKIYRLTHDSRIDFLRAEKVVEMFLLHCGHLLSPAAISIHESHLYKHYLI